MDLDTIRKRFKKSAIFDPERAWEDEKCGRQPMLHPPHARCENGWLKVIARDRTARKKLAVKLARHSGNTSKICYKFLQALPEAVATVLESSGDCLIPNIMKIKSVRICERQPGASKTILGRSIRLRGLAAHHKPICRPTKSFNASVLREDQEPCANPGANEVVRKVVHACFCP